MAADARDATLVLHIGLHKTASSYVQNVLGTRRYDLLREGVLYPTTGTVEGRSSTREGAQSGHALFTRPGDLGELVRTLVAERPDSASTVLLSSEDFSLVRRRLTPARMLSRLDVFGSVKVVLVLRRQDEWVVSLYKQLVDQYANFETRSFEEFVRQAGPTLFDYHVRFSVWRDLVGPENFHVLSYDDLDGGEAICRRLLEVAGVTGPLLDDVTSIPVPRYDSVRAIDTLGLRVLNSYRLPDRDQRIRAARAIYDLAPAGDLELLTPELRDGIQAACRSGNERIEAEWFDTPVPGLTFRTEPRSRAVETPSGIEVAAYLDQVLAVCDAARTTQEQAAAGNTAGTTT